jgi:hypothetical protein
MPRYVTRVAVALIAVVLVGLAVVACDAGKTGTTAADYAGLWVNQNPDNAVWVRVSAHGDKVSLRWERAWSAPVVQPATLQSDGSLKAPAVAGSFDSDGSPAYTGRLTVDGQLDMSTTTHMQGVDAAIPVTLHLERGSPSRYAVFAASVKKNLEAQAVADDFSQALNTIGKGVTALRYEHGGKAPAANEVRPGGVVDKALQASGEMWPRLSNGRLLTPGRGRGEYVYRRLAHGYRIGGLDPNGQAQSISATW